ncbi:hypothetical protein MAR_012277, partial [Mya arenaria]
MRPVDVKGTNQEDVRLATYFAQNGKHPKQITKLKPFNLKLGDYVRISHLKTAFTRANDQTYSSEVFKIHKQAHVYRLRDLQNEDIKGTFYQSELQRTEYNPNSAFKIEKILKTKGKGANKQYFVK